MGRSTIRTPRGSRVYGEALRQGYIAELRFDDRDQARGKQADIVQAVVDFAERKRERAALATTAGAG